MAAQKGLDMLIKLDISGTQTTIGGLRSSSISLSDESLDVTNKDSQGTRTLLAGGGVNSLSISGSGVFTDSAAEVALRTAYIKQFSKTQLMVLLANSNLHLKHYQFLIPNLGTYTGAISILLVT